MKDKFASVSNYIRNLLVSSLFRHIIFVALLLSPVLLIAKFLPEKTRKEAVKPYKELIPNEQKAMPEFTSVEGSPEEKGRLKEQLKVIRLRAKAHVELVLFFGSNYYMAIIISLLAGAIAAIALFLITKSGWDKTNSYIITTFLTMSAVTACFAAFPGMFQQEANMTSNQAFFLQYVALENEILSYSITGQNIDGQRKTATEFIHYLDKEMNRLNAVAVMLDHSKIPTFQLEKAR